MVSHVHSHAVGRDRHDRPGGHDRPGRSWHAAAAVSPFADAYARLSEAFPGLGVTELGAGEAAPRGPGWAVAARLAEGGPDLDAFLSWDEAQVLRDYGTRARPDVVAGFGLHRYAW